MLKATQVSPLKYQGTLLYFFIGGGEVIREGGHFDFFHLDTLLREGCLLVGGISMEKLGYIRECEDIYFIL